MRSGKKSFPGGSNASLFWLLALAVGHLGLLWYFKYHNQRLGLNEFRVEYPGNIINLIIFGLIILGIIVVRFVKGTPYQKIFSTGIKLAIFSACLMVAARITSLNIFTFPNEYYSGQPLKKIVIGALYFTSLGIQLFTLTYLWLRILRVGEHLVLRSLMHSVLIFCIMIMAAYWFDIRIPQKAPNEKEYEVGVVMGAAVWSQNKPSPVLISRIQKAIKMYEAKRIKKIQLTGANAPGEISEADAAFNYIKNYDIPLNDVWLEKQTTSTTEQIRFIKNTLAVNHELKHICVISDSYHANRIEQIGKFYNLNIQIVGAEIKLGLEKKIAYHLRESIALLIFWLFGL